jgi:uncharacterized protein
MATPVLTSILVKPAGPDCGMDCGYCFYSGKSGLYPQTHMHRMSAEILDETMRRFLKQPTSDLSVGWQGGEPSLMGLPFFRKAVELEKLYGDGKSIGNGFQTNGLLLDREWAKFFREYKFLIGLSIDGPAHVHDRYRRLRNGDGTWAQVSAAAGMLLDEGVPVNALTVVNDYSARYPEEIYDHHRDLGLSYMQFIPCVETDPGDRSRAAPFSVTAEAYGAFLCRIFDRWRADFRGGTPQTSVRFFESLLFRYAGFAPPDCTLCEKCGTCLVVEHNGDVYSCDFFVEPAWLLGNVMSDGLAGMFASERHRQFSRRKAELTASCAACPWLTLCRGGCPKDRVRDPRDRGESHFCGAYRIFFEHAHAHLKKLADAGKRKVDLEEAQFPAAAPSGRVGRNEPCPCGSGLKFKKCCGR